MPQNIITVVGSPTIGFSGDGGSVNSAKVNFPNTIAFDRYDNMYFVDAGNNRIRKVNSAGIINTIAGNGGSSFSGDGGPATLAEISPNSIAIDTEGNIYFSEPTHRIRKVTVAGMIGTVAGTGSSGYNGDNISATTAELFYPYLGGVDQQGNIILSDYNNHRVRKINTLGVITTIAGNGINNHSGDGGPATDASIKNPAFTFVATDGSIFIPDNTDRRIRKVDATGIITTIAGSGGIGESGDGGPATNATFELPNSVALDAYGNLYIASTGGHVIRKVDPAGIISTVAGTGVAGYAGDNAPATAAQLHTPNYVAFNHAGNLYIADADNNRIRRITYNSIHTTNIKIDTLAYTIFPNPSQNNIAIKASCIITSLQIFSFIGKEVYRDNPYVKEKSIDVSLYPAGVYFVRINSTISAKFIKL